jgi:hypothetical protein
MEFEDLLTERVVLSPFAIRIYNRLFSARELDLIRHSESSELWELLENLVKAEANLFPGHTVLAESQLYGIIEKKIQARESFDDLELKEITLELDTIFCSTEVFL